MISDEVLPSIVARSVPRNFSAARLINRYFKAEMLLTMIGDGTFSMIVSGNERVRSSRGRNGYALR